MQTSSASPLTITTAPPNTTAVTKSREQILIQSGAMIAVIVIGIIIILSILLIILKTYNGSKQRAKVSQATGQSSLPLSTMGPISVSGSINPSFPASENGFVLPRAELNSIEGNHLEQFSTMSDSTEVTIHDAPSLGDT
uniref:Si:dkey-221l4.10 n=1 Tax=Cynoglossus semilaevis TaxID=244447 RepID=A0A3P8UJY4_CYNSE